MKKTFIFLIFITTSLYLFGQDMITRTNGDKIMCTITKVDTANVYFDINRNGRKLSSFIKVNQVQDIRYNVAQSSNLPQSDPTVKNPARPDTLPRVSIGIGTGINSFTGMLGLSLNVRFVDKLSIRGAFGTGGWGGKLSGGLKYDTRYNGGWSFSLGYSYFPGLKNVPQSLQLEGGTTQTVHLNYFSTSNVNLSALYNWRLGWRNTFYLEFGYAIPTQVNRWELIENLKLSDNSKNVINLIQPGGIILGLGFTFGF